MIATKIEVLIVSLPGILRRILMDTLEQLPVSVIGVATGGLSAVEILKGHQPDLVILDANLPYQETFMLLKHIRAEYPSLRCLVLSETSRDRASLAEAGADFSLLSLDVPRELSRVIGEVQTSPGSQFRPDI